MIDMRVELKREPKKPKMVVGDVFESGMNIYMIAETDEGFGKDKFYRAINLKTAKYSNGFRNLEMLMNGYPDAKRLEQVTAAEFVEE